MIDMERTAIQRTRRATAMGAALANQVWSISEWLTFRARNAVRLRGENQPLLEKPDTKLRIFLENRSRSAPTH